MFSTMSQYARQSPLRDLTPALLAWEAFVLCAIIGYGFTTLRLFKRTPQPLGIALCAGVTAWLLIGGWLNLFTIATRPVLWSFLSLGFILFIFESIQRRLPKHIWSQLRSGLPTSRPARIVSALLVLWLLLVSLLHLGSFTWDRYDDVTAYMAFASKASALGGLLPEPFSERRITNGFGGTMYLDTTMLAGAGFTAIDFIESFIGYLAVLLCLHTLSRRFRLDAWQSIAVYSAFFFFSLGHINLTSVNFSAAIFLALFILLLEGEPSNEISTRNAALIGLLSAAAFALKSSNIPFCALFVFITTVVYAWRRRSLHPLLALPIATLAGVAMLVPWAIRHRIDEGTVLFPTLGRGLHISAYGFPLISQTTTHQLALLVSLDQFLFPAIAAVAALYLLRNQSRIPRTLIVAFLAATAIAAPLFSVSIAGQDIIRFTLPTEVLSAIFFLITLLVAFRPSPSRKLAWVALVLFALWAKTLYSGARWHHLYRDPSDLVLLTGTPNLTYLNMYGIMLKPAELAAQTAAIRCAQEAVPPGAPLLENVLTAFGFDWHRNPVFIADFPGMAGPPPGMPIDGTAEDLRLYLLQHNIHYIVFDRALHDLRFAALYPSWRSDPIFHVSRRDMFDLHDPPEVNGYILMEVIIAERIRHMFEVLSHSQPVLYDDGRLAVISLDHPQP
jgi:hypothetical protein